ncbi:MAG: hypothetical protein WA173_05225 [Pseudomonas sp.]|uniref:hypothetical protein n=1 Tax=Pseudomonas sp. TaxID=306 RepID=UPI003BB50FF7
MPTYSGVTSNLDQQHHWQPLSTAALVGVLLFAVAALWFGNSGERWFPLLDGANLLFHEFGHPFFGLFSAPLMVYGGTLAQLIFPVATAVSFYRTGATASFAICVIWGLQNCFNIARYMADARAQLLPLVGGGEHDWTEILSRWGWLQADTRLAAWLTALGWLGIGYCCFWLIRRWRQERRQP